VGKSAQPSDAGTQAGTSTQQSGTSRLTALFWETGSLPFAIPQIVKVSTSHVGVTHNFYLVNAGGSQQEGAFNSNAVRGDAAYRKVGIVATLTYSNNGATEFLDTLPLALTNTQMNAYIVTGPQLGDVFINGRFQSFQ